MSDAIASNRSVAAESAGSNSHTEDPRRAPAFAVCARENGNGLIRGECLALTGSATDDDGFASIPGGVTPFMVDATRRSAYMRFLATTVALASSVDELARMVGAIAPESEGFRIDLYRLPGAPHVGTQETVSTVADRLPGAPSLTDPLCRFALVARAEGLWLGRIVATSSGAWRRHQEKPWRTSSSLPQRLARALVNIAAPAERMLNPGCGTGSLLLEAAEMGHAAFGIDRNRRMVGMARANLARFGYGAAGEQGITVEHGDARTWAVSGDVVVSDLPYDRGCHLSEDDARAVIERSRALAPRGVFVAGRDIANWLLSVGYQIDGHWSLNGQPEFARQAYQVSAAQE